ncbi:hypothetical protein [Leucobacter soli]|uniref:hypothetical protein n=1 Tax=Leucobacter soli TaxID=2812850 RepID=UPI00360ED409
MQPISPRLIVAVATSAVISRYVGLDVLKFLVLLNPQRVVAGMADVPARSCPRGQREERLNAQEAEVVQAEAMPAAMIERCSCGDRSDLGALSLESHLPAAEREDDQDRQRKAAEDPEQAGDNTDQDALADGGLPHGVGEVSHCGVEGGAATVFEAAAGAERPTSSAWETPHKPTTVTIAARSSVAALIVNRRRVMRALRGTEDTPRLYRAGSRRSWEWTDVLDMLHPIGGR